MRKSPATIACCFALCTLFAVHGLVRGETGLKIMEPDTEGLCKDETAAGEAVRRTAKRQADMMQEMMAVLRRMAAIQKKMAEGVSPAEGKELGRELSGMMARTGRMMSDLQGMMDMPRKNP